MHEFLLHSGQSTNLSGGAVAATWFESPAVASRLLQRLPTQTDLVPL